jgi:hypothetical protein
MKYLLSKGEVLIFEGTGAIEAVTVRTGRVWLTRYRDPADYCLEAGAVLPLGREKRVAIEALEDAAVSVLWREAAVRFTLTLAWSRQSLAR